MQPGADRNAPEWDPPFHVRFRGKGVQTFESLIKLSGSGAGKMDWRPPQVFHPRIMRPVTVEPGTITESKVFQFASVAGISEEFRGSITKPPRRLHQFFEGYCHSAQSGTAVVLESEQLTYADLEFRANRLAHLLIARGDGPGRRAGILLNRSAQTYVALLAVLKAGSAFVPLDPSYPADRLAFIAADAGLTVVLTDSELAASHPGLPCQVLCLDREEPALSGMPSARPALPDEGDTIAYVMYTSGTTGRPKGVAVTHANICHFLSVCTPIYGVRSHDRVYQGMTIAFDFSIEEIWPTFIAGGTLISGPIDGRRLGPALAEFLIEQKVNVFCCVPTLLATLDRDVPSIHTLVVGGEPCPLDLVERWSRSGRRILNTYGPTETTVTATWCELKPGRTVTIGRPMPGYRIHLLDESLQPVPHGEAGEICIGGAGVAQGYVNSPELTAAKFVADPFELGRRLYRSGDLGRLTADGEIEFLGRIDDQVKVRGYRIELKEIEAVLLEDPEVASAIVTVYPANSAVQDLAAYITVRGPCSLNSVRERLVAEMRSRLPAYMLPAYIEVLDVMPSLPNGKAARLSLPPPVLGRVTFPSGDYEPPSTPLEHKIAAVWQALFGLERISIDSDFFLELGGHSLLAAQLVTRLRQQPETAALSVADVYTHPTIRALAAGVGRQTEAAAAAPGRAARRHSSSRVFTAGLVQLGLLYPLLAAFGAPVSFFMVQHSSSGAFSFTRIALLMPLLEVLVSLLVPLALKWLLIGRFRPGEYQLWGWYFCRWWIVRKSLEFSPLRFFAGSPLMPVYARLLGARVKNGCQINTAHFHLPDLIEIDEGASIGYDAEIQPFVIEGGWLRLAPIRIGAGAFIGAKAVVLAGAEIGSHARVAEQTLVSSGQRIPDFETWMGSPAQRTKRPKDLLAEIETLGQAPRRISTPLWAAFGITAVLLQALPLALAIPGVLLIAWAGATKGFPAALMATPLAGLIFVVATCLVILGAKRAVMPNARPGIYPHYSWFGFQKWTADQLMFLSLTLTNSLYATLYVLPWLRALGARIGPRSEVSTVSHVDPDLLTLGSETFVADIASVGAATYHNGWVALARTEVGNRTFLGNASMIRSGTLPDHCLIGVQSVVPREGVRAGSSWLGCPAIFLPRREAAPSFAERLTYKPPFRLLAYRLFVELFRSVLPASLFYALGTTVTTLGSRLPLHTTAAAVLAMPWLYLVSAAALTLVAVVLKWAIVGRYHPRVEPLWAPFVRHSELITGVYEGFVVPALAMLVTGTPWIGTILRLFGVHMGNRVYCETTFTTEFDLLRVGDDAVIGRAASLQTHLFEDRVMKMSTVTVGRGAEIGARSVVLYDATVGEYANLDALSLAMKGEVIPPSTNWRGIPARSAM
jgi:non-ribosomal peptide synthetase-like protein